MNFHVTNCELCVGHIDVTGVSASSMLIIGDTKTVQLSSAFDTPPESLIVGSLVPFKATS